MFVSIELEFNSLGSYTLAVDRLLLTPLPSPLDLNSTTAAYPFADESQLLSVFPVLTVIDVLAPLVLNLRI